jgi:D-beta-D-heptose 7-phosphate kinase/D-beta-D-heptose 1-phosphate adenosyltransferase
VRNIAALGGKADIIGVVGQDSAGGDIARDFAALPGVTPHILTDTSRPTTQKTRYIAQGQQLLRADYEVVRPVAPALEEQIIRKIFANIGDTKVIVLSDYAKGVLTAKIIAEVTRLARDAGKTVIVDPKGRDFGRYRGASYLTPNRKELSDALGTPIGTVAEAEEAARLLIRQMQIGGILVKLGSDGVCLVVQDKPALHMQTTAREVYDVSGAGDTVAATLALALAADFTPADAAELANVAGSVVVGKVGTAAVTREDIEHELLNDAPRKATDKIASRSAIADIAERWHKQGFKVGFTNGVFDLLHPGHVALLRQARAACDRLVVGLNNDESTRRLKGAGRPVNNEIARATVLGSLTDVDQVVLFEEDTPYDLIRVIRPNLLVKGSNFKREDIVGADLVQGWGGKIILADLVDGQSTSGVISRITK